ncbi:hypothetical protein ACFUJT_19380 [Streptomyces griseoincarnatus]
MSSLSEVAVGRVQTGNQGDFRPREQALADDRAGEVAEVHAATGLAEDRPHAVLVIVRRAHRRDDERGLATRGRPGQEPVVVFVGAVPEKWLGLIAAAQVLVSMPSQRGSAPYSVQEMPGLLHR